MFLWLQRAADKKVKWVEKKTQIVDVNRFSYQHKPFLKKNPVRLKPLTCSSPAWVETNVRQISIILTVIARLYLSSKYV